MLGNSEWTGVRIGRNWLHVRLTMGMTKGPKRVRPRPRLSTVTPFFSPGVLRGPGDHVIPIKFEFFDFFSYFQFITESGPLCSSISNQHQPAGQLAPWRPCATFTRLNSLPRPLRSLPGAEGKHGGRKGSLLPLPIRYPTLVLADS